jgi:hypothetical protein
MGDYSRGHFEFTLKEDTPLEVKQALDGLVTGDGFDLPSGDKLYRGTSAYHPEPTYAVHDTTPEDYLDRYSLQFQIKYGCEQLREFAEWLAPHVVVDKKNKGFIGCSLSEYVGTVTTFIVKDGKVEL